MSFQVKDTSNGLSLLEECVNHLFDWFNTNRLKLNPGKTKVMFCGTRPRLRHTSFRPLDICGASIESSPAVKCLGVTFDSFLSFDSHILKMCQLAFNFIRLLYRIRPYLSEETTRQIVVSYIITRLDYCNSLLVACSGKRLQRLQRIQNCCVRLVKRLSRRTPTSSSLRDLHWLPITKRITFKLCCIAHRCIYGDAPEYLKKLIKPANSRTVPLALRSHNAMLLHQPIPHINAASGGFAFAGPKAWNHLPAHCRSVNDYTLFKRVLKTELF